jgi:glutamyl-tRNA reductase
MHIHHSKIPEYIISRFCVAGINYHKSSVTERSMFAINQQAYQNILLQAKQYGIISVFAVSTCNRAEVYAYCQHDSELLQLLIDNTSGTYEVFQKTGFIKRGIEALDHLFKVAAGLDSQIVGDYEILGQLKTAIAFSRKYSMIGPIMDRTINFMMQASKSVKTNTLLSTGTVSVSYAAIEWLKQYKNINDKKVLLFGTGKFGRNVVKNLKFYCRVKEITVVNRTNEVAQKLAHETSVSYKTFEQLPQAIAEADIIIVCTNAASYTLLPQFFNDEKERLILDLSVPENVHPGIKNIKHITVAGVDDVSKIMQQTISNRNKEIPKAKKIIETFKAEFFDWLAMYQHVSMINEMKDKLISLSGLHPCEMAVDVTQSNAMLVSNRVNKTVNTLAMNLREKKEKGCLYIHAYNDFLHTNMAE